MKTFKVLVQSKEHSMELAYYLDDHIREINRLGICVRVEKIGADEMDDEMAEALRKRGITRLPAMIMNDGCAIIGKDKIIDMFEKGVQGQRRGAKLSADSPGMEYGTNPDMSEFWMRELYNRNGHEITPKKDEDEDRSEGFDMERRMRDYERNIPKHRRGGETRERDFDQTAVQQQQKRGGRNHGPPPIINDDNIADTPYDEPRGSHSGDVNGDAMDEKMMSAWMQNNPVSEY